MNGEEPGAPGPRRVRYRAELLDGDFEVGAGCTTVVCDHDACRDSEVGSVQTMAVLREAVRSSRGGILIRAIGCLGPCKVAQGRTVVAVHNRANEAESGSDAGLTAWISVLSLAMLDDLASWIAAGGPGCALLPPTVDRSIIAVV